MKISVLGCGRWGSFIAWYLDKIGHDVALWGRRGSEKLEKFAKNLGNDLLEISKSIELTNDLDYAVNRTDVFVISISAQSFRKFLVDLNKINTNFSKKIVILCMKGLEENSGKRLSEIIKEEMLNPPEIGVWVGPGHVQDITRGIPTCMVLDSKSENIKKSIIPMFSSNLIRIYYGNDLIGTEIGAAAKNVIGIAAGILDGLEMSSLKGALMARGTAEISNLIEAMGGKTTSAFGLCHLGDYEATLFSIHSNNRLFGENFVKNIQNKKLAEGVATSQAIFNLSKKYNIDMPICNAVHEVITSKKAPQTALTELFKRPLISEI